MPRLMDGEQARAYRAVVTYRFDRDPRTGLEGGTSISYFGPFAAKSAATAAISREIRQRGSYRYWQAAAEVTGVVECSSLVWEPVTGAPKVRASFDLDDVYGPNRDGGA